MIRTMLVREMDTESGGEREAKEETGRESLEDRSSESKGERD